ncbi:MAG: hypothetical protein WCP89_00690 [archaeon]
MKKFMSSVFDWVVLCLFVVVIIVLVFVHDRLAVFPLVWLKKIIRRTTEFFMVMVFFTIVNILLFVDEYLLVGPEVWVERSGKVMFSVFLLAMFALGCSCICRALGPHAGFHSIVQLLAGMSFFIITLTGFHYRQKVWSLSL